MKSAIITAALLFATAAQAEQAFKVEAHLTLNGKPAGDYVAEIPEDVTGQFSNTLHRLQTVSITATEGEIPKRVSEPLVTGLQLAVTPKTEAEGKILLSYDLDYRELLSMKHEPVDGSAVKADLPTTHQVQMAGTFVTTSGEQTKQSGSGKNGNWELTLKATKL